MATIPDDNEIFWKNVMIDSYRRAPGRVNRRNVEAVAFAQMSQQRASAA
jgi:hypothetical protein